jgi:hypothetical protein
MESLRSVAPGCGNSPEYRPVGQLPDGAVVRVAPGGPLGMVRHESAAPVVEFLNGDELRLPPVQAVWVYYYPRDLARRFLQRVGIVRLTADLP